MTAKRLFLGMALGLGLTAGANAQPMPPAKSYPTPPVADQPGAMAPAAPTATSVLTGDPAAKGVVESPWSGGTPAGCCGPTGANGPLTYELVMHSGPSLPVTGGVLTNKMNTGWAVGGGIRTLYFNRAADAAWTFNTGLTYIYNRGQQNLQFEVLTPQPRNAAGVLLGPDALTVNFLRGVHRTSLDLGIGRDWWLNGPAAVNAEGGWNTRFGVDAGGRWGTAHVDLVPVLDTKNYLRRSSIFHSVFVGTHLDWEVPMGSWIFVSGFRAEWDYTWTNLIPPSNGDIVSVNLWFNAGVRY